MKKFSEYIDEKATKKINGGWTILKLDDGTELMSNMELINKGKIQIALPNEAVKTINLKKNKQFIEQIEKIIGQKLDIKCLKTKEFIELYPCECET